MKKILISLSIIGAIAAVVAGITIALFNDTETSAGNIFTAGSIDLKVDHALATYNGEICSNNCSEGDNNLIVNGGFETPDVPTGSWAIYPDASLTFWTVEAGAGLEIQDHAAGAPHGGNQLGELDSNNSSAISQAIATVAGGKYRLKFWYSPRPNRPAGDNTIGMDVKVVSDNSVIISDIIGTTAVGGSGTSWQEFVYDFVAVDTNTKIMFSDLGTNNSYGGYLDDISVRTLNCSNTFPGGGTCALWGEKDLGVGDTFWTFNDVKPGDHGTNLISLHASSNDAYSCLYVNNTQDNENNVVDPEVEAGDDPFQFPTPHGELSKYLNVVVWPDNGDGVHQPGEVPLYNGPIDTELVQLSLTSGHTQYVGIAWCAGTQTIDGGTGVISCNGAGNQNDAQTDSFLADVIAYAVQQRNNDGFNCRDVDLSGPVQY